MCTLMYKWVMGISHYVYIYIYNVVLYTNAGWSEIELQISDSPPYIFRQKFAAAVTISAARVLYCRYTSYGDI